MALFKYLQTKLDVGISEIFPYRAQTIADFYIQNVICNSKYVGKDEKDDKDKHDKDKDNKNKHKGSHERGDDKDHKSNEEKHEENNEDKKRYKRSNNEHKNCKDKHDKSNEDKHNNGEDKHNSGEDINKSGEDKNEKNNVNKGGYIEKIDEIKKKLFKEKKFDLLEKLEKGGSYVKEIMKNKT